MGKLCHVEFSIFSDACHILQDWSSMKNDSITALTA